MKNLKNILSNRSFTLKHHWLLAAYKSSVSNFQVSPFCKNLKTQLQNLPKNFAPVKYFLMSQWHENVF